MGLRAWHLWARGPHRALCLPRRSAPPAHSFLLSAFPFCASAFAPSLFPSAFICGCQSPFQPFRSAPHPCPSVSSVVKNPRFRFLLSQFLLLPMRPSAVNPISAFASAVTPEIFVSRKRTFPKTGCFPTLFCVFSLRCKPLSISKLRRKFRPEIGPEKLFFKNRHFSFPGNERFSGTGAYWSHDDDKITSSAGRGAGSGKPGANSPGPRLIPGGSALPRRRPIHFCF